MHPLGTAMPQQDFNVSFFINSLLLSFFFLLHNWLFIEIFVFFLFCQQPEEHYHQDYNSPYRNQQMPMRPGYDNMQQQQQQQQPVQPHQPVQPVQHARIAEPERPKAPIPDEHLHLKTVLDELKLQCHESAKNPVIKFYF